MASEPILIVDDNPANLKLARLLSRPKATTRGPRRTPSRRSRLRDFRPQLILMDIQLPGMDGLELTRRLKASPRTKGIIVIALTAYAMKGTRSGRARPAATATSPSRSTSTRCPA